MLRDTRSVIRDTSAPLRQCLMSILKAGIDIVHAVIDLDHMVPYGLLDSEPVTSSSAATVVVTTKPRDIRQLASECSQIMAGVYYVVTLAT